MKDILFFPRYPSLFFSLFNLRGINVYGAPPHTLRLVRNKNGGESGERKEGTDRRSFSGSDSPSPPLTCLLLPADRFFLFGSVPPKWEKRIGDRKTSRTGCACVRYEAERTTEKEKEKD